MEEIVVIICVCTAGRECNIRREPTPQGKGRAEFTPILAYAPQNATVIFEGAPAENKGE